MRYETGVYTPELHNLLGETVDKLIEINIITDVMKELLLQ